MLKLQYRLITIENHTKVKIAYTVSNPQLNAKNYIGVSLITPKYLFLCDGDVENSLVNDVLTD